MITQLQSTQNISEHFTTSEHISAHYNATKNIGLQNDVVHITRPELMTDEEAQEVMTDATEAIVDSPLEAMTVHEGLDISRVMALLEDI